MFSTIYVEEALLSHPRLKAITSRYDQVPVIPVERYAEIFNRKSQNFRLQKRAPALIVASKQNNLVLPAPEQYGLGGKHNYYFSHLLNCIYDCRYCFLQGMYRSAHYVWFVNYEDFAQALNEKINQHAGETSYFYSGYDCDSLALEPITQFVDYFLPLFSGHTNAVLELRTKSTQVRSLLDKPPMENCIIAFSFTPENISRRLEHKVPSNQKRLEAMKKLQQRGWQVGLRFDPLIYDDNYYANYQQLFEEVFSQVDNTRLHSVSLGVFRLPEAFYRNMQRLYPNEQLFAAKLANRDGMVSYQLEIESRLLKDCESLLLKHIPDRIYYPCNME
jgi:spore photoproduct lyase